MTEFFSSNEFIVFACSLVCILLLFAVKKLETGRGKRFAEGLRIRADYGALYIKHWLELSEEYLEHTPFYVVALARYGVHVSALSFARVAKKSAEYAHSLADLVSHKRNFERRETKSQFLKEVSEYKNGKDNDNGTVATL